MINVTAKGKEVITKSNAFGIDLFRVANKPFIFAIRERTTNTLLFIGKVETPGD